MALATNPPLGPIPSTELEEAKEAVRSLRILRTRYHAAWSPPVELIVPHAKLDHESRLTNDRKVKFFNQTALAHGLLLKQEFRLKLLSCLDGYLAAVESENPVLMYLSARYLLELLATIAYLDFELREALKANAADWEARGVRFVTTLCRGRYSSSDPKIADVLQTFGASKKAVKPIGIEGAVRQLSKRPELATASQDYDFFSNMCHHNGSGHVLYHRSMRLTDKILLPWGDLAVFNEPGPAVTLSYPPINAVGPSLVQTASATLAYCAWSEVILQELPLMPFSEAEVQKLTNGLVKNSLNFFVPKSQERTGTLFQNEHAQAKEKRSLLLWIWEEVLELLYAVYGID